MLLLVFLASYSCNESRENANRTKVKIDSINYKIDSLLLKYDCKNEYEYARLCEYAIYYKYFCLKSRCIDINKLQESEVYHDSLQLMNTDIRLNVEDENPINIENDSFITLKMLSFTSNDGLCKCQSFSKRAYPYGITILRNSTKIRWVHSGMGYSFEPGDSLIQASLNNVDMLNYVRNNRAKVNEWFYNELVEKGYLR